MKTLKGRPKRATEDYRKDWNYFEDTDDIDYLEENAHLMKPPRRLCQQQSYQNQKLKRPQGGSVVLVSKEKLLEASLISLETMGRQRKTGVSGSGIDDTTLFSDGTNYDDNNISSSQGGQGQPNDQYLRGALWLGRNFSIIMEELAEGIENYRTKFLNEVTSAANDEDYKRSKHRLNLLANSAVNEALSLTNNSRVRCRDLLQVKYRMMN